MADGGARIDPAEVRDEAVFAWTGFPNQYAQESLRYSTTLPQLATVIRAPAEPAKADLPFIKLATFGENRSGKDCYRHDANVTSVTGVEGDYDGGAITFADAGDRLRKAGIAALVYSTPSNTADKPRWRVLCPLAAEIRGSENEMRQARSALMDRLNGVFGGGLAPESWTLSQSFYFGAVTGKPTITVEVVNGAYIDERPDLPSLPNRRTASGKVR
jgi:hypothetical protein